MIGRRATTSGPFVSHGAVEATLVDGVAEGMVEDELVVGKL